LKRKLWVAAILAFSLLALSLPAAAQTQAGPRLSATPAYDGYFKYGEWLPIWIELENQGKDVDGEVRVQVTGSQGTTVFAAPITLPTGSRKQFPLYILPNNFSRELQVNLVSKGQVLATQRISVRPQPNISFFVGLASPERGALGLLNAIVLPGQDRPKVIVDVELAELPERPEALRSLDVLVLNNVDTGRLTPGQAGAIETWVRAGGRLVIGGGAGALETTVGLPETLLPAHVQNTVEVAADNIQELARFAGADPILGQQRLVAAVGKPDAESQRLAGSEALPLVIERAVGNGSVDFVAFDLSGVPFNGWPGTQTFWEKLLAPGAAYPPNMPFDVSLRQMRGNQLFYALTNIPSLDLPSIQGLTILLLVYIVMVGPANYLALRRLRRLHLAWVTIPAITLAFTAGAFWTGYVMRGTDLLMNKIAIVEVQPGGTAAVTSYMGLFSPRQQSYEILVEGGGLVSPMTGYDGGGWGPGGPSIGGEMVFTQGNPSTIRGLTVNQFSMQSFMAEETWDDFGQIRGDLRMENDVLTGVVRNETPYTLTDVVVVIQTRFVRLGDLAPGEEAKVDLGLGNLQAERFGPPISYLVFQDRMNQTGPNPRAVDLKINILSAVLDNNMSWGAKAAINSRVFPGGDSSITRGNPVTVFGWLDQAPPNVEVRNNRLSQQTTALVYTSLNFNISESGAISLHIGMVPGSLSKMPRDGGPCGPNNTASVSMGSGEAEFEFRVPAELGDARLKALKLNIWRDSGGDWALPEVALWNWQNESWNAIQDPVMGTNEIREPAGLVSDGGAIRVRLKSDGAMFACYYLDMGLDAERGPATGGAQ